MRHSSRGISMTPVQKQCRRLYSTEYTDGNWRRGGE